VRSSRSAVASCLVDNESAFFEDGASDARTDAASHAPHVVARRFHAVGAPDGFENRRGVLRPASETDVSRQRVSDVETRARNPKNVDGIADDSVEVAAVTVPFRHDSLCGFRFHDGARAVDTDAQTAVQASRLARQVKEAEM
jgi:hypothetical protein